MGAESLLQATPRSRKFAPGVRALAKLAFSEIIGRRLLLRRYSQVAVIIAAEIGLIGPTVSTERVESIRSICQLTVDG